ncbi:MAG: CHASE2 domain-containing protein [Spirochaetales bacterium]|nr:CHASE2 domain-containing protein [Spirochaetales bacterium]
MNKMVIRCFILSLALLFPHLLSPLFPGFFTIHNTRLNDCFFKLRYSLTGSAPVSPYLVLCFLDDPLPPPEDNTGIWNAILNKLGNKQLNLKSKTILVYPDSNFSYKEMKVQGGTGKLFLPGMILNHRTTGNPDILNRIKDVAFVPKVYYHGCRGYPGNLEEAALSFPEIVTGVSEGTGIANLFPDADGVVRRLPLFYTSGEGLYYPSLFLAALCHYCDVKPDTIEIGRGQVKLPRAYFRMATRDMVIPVDEKGQMLINYPGPRDASFDLLSAARLLELVEVETGSLISSSPESLILTGDISTCGGKFSTSIYDTGYPDVMILASAFNTVFTDNFLKPADFFEIIILYIPVLIILNLFLVVSEKKTLSFFAIGMPIVSLLVPVLIVCTQLFLFLYLHSLPGLLPLIIGILAALFLLLIFRLLRSFIESKDIAMTFLLIISQLLPKRKQVIPEGDSKAVTDIKTAHMEIKKQQEEILGEIDNFNLIEFFGKEKIIEMLRELKFNSDQVKITLYLLEGQFYKEIKEKMDLPSENTVGQRIQKIYKKCNVHTKEDLIIMIIKLLIIKYIKVTDSPYLPSRK